MCSLFKMKDRMECNLIDAVSKKSFLWDIACAEYKDRDLRKKTFPDIAKELGIKFFWMDFYVLVIWSVVLLVVLWLGVMKILALLIKYFTFGKVVIHGFSLTSAKTITISVKGLEIFITDLKLSWQNSRLKITSTSIDIKRVHTSSTKSKSNSFNLLKFRYFQYANIEINQFTYLINDDAILVGENFKFIVINNQFEFSCTISNFKYTSSIKAFPYPILLHYNLSLLVCITLQLSENACTFLSCKIPKISCAINARKDYNFLTQDVPSSTELPPVLPKFFSSISELSSALPSNAVFRVEEIILQIDPPFCFPPIFCSLNKFALSFQKDSIVNLGVTIPVISCRSFQSNYRLLSLNLNVVSLEILDCFSDHPRWNFSVSNIDMYLALHFMLRQIADNEKFEDTSIELFVRALMVKSLINCSKGKSTLRSRLEECDGFFNKNNEHLKFLECFQFIVHNEKTINNNKMQNKYIYFTRKCNVFATPFLGTTFAAILLFLKTLDIRKTKSSSSKLSTSIVFEVKQMDARLILPSDGLIQSLFQSLKLSFHEQLDISCLSLKSYLSYGSGSLFPLICFSYLSLSFINRILKVCRLQRLCISWSPNAHMTIFELLKIVNSHGTTSRFKLPRKKLAYRLDDMLSSINNFDFCCDLLHCHVFTSRSTSNSVFIHELMLSFIDKQAKINLEKLLVFFDEHCIIKCGCIDALYECISISDCKTRRIFQNISPRNHQLKISANKFAITFPFGYDFYVNYTEIVSVRKWLKELHSSIDNDENAKLYSTWPDFLFNFGKFSIEFQDDPFEVKMSRNYFLMRDEYFEIEKRHKLLENWRLEKQRHMKYSSHSSTFYDTINDIFNRKNGEIYISRWKDVYDKSSSYEAVMTITFHDMKLFSFTDEAFLGHDNLKAQLKLLDPISPLPESFNFNTAFCRMFHIYATSFTVGLRNYPDAMLHLENPKLFGKFMLASILPPVVPTPFQFDVGHPFKPVTLKRIQTHLKAYYDFNLVSKHFNYTFGQNRDAAFTCVNQAISKINKPSSDPGPPLPFWDKYRYILHGRLQAACEETDLVWLTSFDPYNTTDKLMLKWNSFFFEWHHGRFLLKGDLIVSISPSELPKDEAFMTAYRTNLTFQFTYQCKGNSDDHHAVIPAHRSARSEDWLDTYNRFRSKSFDLKIHLKIKPFKLESDTIVVPLIKMYGSTLAWLEQFRALLRHTCRPVRRGVIWKNVKPRKKSFGRHYRKLSLSIDIPHIMTEYQQSITCRRAVQFRIHGNSSIRSEFNLKLTVLDDGLKRRPSTQWDVRTTHVCFAPSDIFLFPDEAEIGQNHLHLVSITKLEYSRSRDGLQTITVNSLLASLCPRIRSVLLLLYDDFLKNRRFRVNLTTKVLQRIKICPIEPEIPLNNQDTTLEMRHINQLLGSDGSAMHVTADFKEQPIVDEEIGEIKLQIQLECAQITLQGNESIGAILVTSRIVELKRFHYSPRWYCDKLYTKTSTNLSLSQVQCFASSVSNANLWLPKSIVSKKGSFDIKECLSLEEVVRPSSSELGGSVQSDDGTVSLVRIMSSPAIVVTMSSHSTFAESNDAIPHQKLPEISKRPVAAELIYEQTSVALATNASQTRLLGDVVASLLRWHQPRTHTTILGSREDVARCQTRVRSLLSSLQNLRRELSIANRIKRNNCDNLEVTKTNQILDHQLKQTEERLNTCVDRLNALVLGWREQQLREMVSVVKPAKPIPVSHAVIKLERVIWQLLMDDLTFAKAELKDVHYAREATQDGCAEHSLDVLFAHLSNLLPNDYFKDCIKPTFESEDVLLRIFIKIRPPVGGIVVHEIVQVDVRPLTIQLTNKFWAAMKRFIFPPDFKHEIGSESDALSEDVSVKELRIPKKKSVRSNKALPKTNMFVMVHISQFPLVVSYKGSKNINFKDINEARITISDFRIVNKTLSWPDVLTQFKRHAGKQVVKGLFQEKFHLLPNLPNTTPGIAINSDEEKARLLLNHELLTSSHFSKKK